MQRLIKDSTSSSADLDDLPSWVSVVNYAIWQVGGYTSVPDTAHPSDQATLMVYAFGAGGINLSPEAETGYLRALQQDIEAWIASGSRTALDAYLQQQPVWQEFR